VRGAQANTDERGAGTTEQGSARVCQMG